MSYHWYGIVGMEIFCGDQETTLEIKVHILEFLVIMRLIGNLKNTVLN